MIYLSNIDIAGFIVAVLGVITTILLGWNIYTFFDFKDRILKIDEKDAQIREAIKHLYKRENMLDGHTHSVIADTYLSIIDGDIDKSIYLTEKAHSLISYSKAKEYDKCNKVVAEMIAYINSNHAHQMSDEGFQVLFDILSSVDSLNGIQDIQSLIALVYIRSQHKQYEQKDS